MIRIPDPILGTIRTRLALAGLLLSAGFASPAAANPVVLETSPADQDIGVSLSAKISVTFSGSLDPGTVTADNILVTSQLRGTLSGLVTLFGSGDRVRFTPEAPFLAGERITVTVTKGVTDLTGESLPNGHHFQFTSWTAPVPEGEFLVADESWSIGEIALNLTVADLDGDGLPEAIFSNVVPDSLTILTPDGPDSFTLLAQLSTGILPRHTAVGDVDGNGFPDLVCCASGPNEVQIFLNHGSGTFDPAQAYSTGQTPYGTFVGDLDADGDLDVATANFNGHSVSILKNLGDGSFGPASDFPAGKDADSPRWVDGADFDGDGDIDLACCNGYSSDVSVFLNDGDGAFVLQPGLVAVEESPNFMEARDFNGDGLVDLLTVNAGPGSLSLLTGNGDGTFQPATHHPVGGTLPYGIHVADMEGDGDLDVLVPIRGTNNWRIMANDGHGTFDRGQAYTGGDHCHTIGAADWDGDGDIDVVAGFAQSEDMYYYRCVATPSVVSTSPAVNTTGAPVNSPVAIFFNTALAPETVTPATFRVTGSQSGPHRPTITWVPEQKKVQMSPGTRFAPGEIVTVTVDGTGSVKSAEGIDHGGFAFEFMAEGIPSAEAYGGVTIDLPGLDPVAVDAADLNGDGASDLVVANFLSGNVTLLLSGSGDLPSLTANLPTAASPYDLWTGDISGNDRIDIAISTLSSTISLLFNAGGGFFQPGPSIATTGSPFGITGGDFDVDGDLDLAVCEIDPNCIQIHWNDGTGEFPDTSVLPVAGAPLDIARADLDRDGDLDLVVADSENNRIEAFLNDAQNGFVSAGVFPTGESPVSVFAWDANGDGWIDLITADFESGGVSVLEHVGSGAVFRAPISLASGIQPHGIFGADLTGDSMLDLAVANSGSSEITLFRSEGNGVFDAGTSLGVGAAPYSVTGGDWDGDGTVDLAAVNRSGGSLTFLLNGQSSGVPPAPPRGTALLSAAPNPFRGSVLLQWYLADRQGVALRVFDLRGRAVATIFDGELPAGPHQMSWDGRNRLGAPVATGVYFLRMDARENGWSRKLIHVR